MEIELDIPVGVEEGINQRICCELLNKQYSNFKNNLILMNG
ncbi:hypothetical protein ACIQZM_09705 [Peribacillus sp. NPDC097206]